MDFEMNEDVSNYESLLELLEKIVTGFYEQETKYYPTIQQQLFKCVEKINLTISLETNSDNFHALFQQKQQLIKVTNTIYDIMNEEAKLSVNKHIIDEPKQYRFFHVKKNVDNKNGNTENITAVVQNSMEIPKIKGLHEIIGLYEIKKMLKTLVILPRMQPQLFHDRQICNTILLYGPPGTGKTQLVHGLAAEAHATFLCVSAGDILSRYVGETEKTIKSLFQYLKQSPGFTILFIDEIDAFCRKRCDNEQDHSRRLKTEFMCQMSNIEGSKNMFIVCATNCPWDLDSAILRRLHKRIYIPLPDHLERLEIFQFLTKSNYFEENITDWACLLQKTDGYSSSDLFDIVQTALTIPLNELEDNKIWKRCDDGFYEPILKEQDFTEVICSELCDLPSNSVRARKTQMTDLLMAADTVKSTVAHSDVEKYNCFNSH